MASSTERIAGGTGGGPVAVMSKDTKGKDAKGKGKDGGEKKSKKMKIIIAVVALLAVGGIAKFTVLAPAPASAEAKKPTPGAVIPIEDMTLNLSGGHFLRLKMTLQTVKGTSDELDTSKAQQLIIDEFSNKTVASLTGKANRDKVQAELLTKVQKAYPKEIISVPYTEFVMQ